MPVAGIRNICGEGEQYRGEMFSGSLPKPGPGPLFLHHRVGRQVPEAAAHVELHTGEHQAQVELRLQLLLIGRLPVRANVPVLGARAVLTAERRRQ